LGFDHLYTTWWFFSLLALLSISLISCTISRQFPIFKNAKEFFFKTKKTSFLKLNFFVRLKSIPYLKELILLKIQTTNFYIYQKENIIYGYKGIIGRISPILVHFSLILIMAGSFIGAFKNFKAQEILPKGEIFHIQNTLRIGFLTDLPVFNIRINDFWAEYENNRIHQFYSNLSILDNYGNEMKQQTISVNNPLRYKNIDFYQSDWNLLGIRIENLQRKKISELPLFPLKKDIKSWITWISFPARPSRIEIVNRTIEKPIKLGMQVDQSNFLIENNSFINKSLIFDQFQNLFFVYNSDGNFLGSKNIGDFIFPDVKILEILPSTGLLIKYDPSITIIYCGFGILIITTFLSYLPYSQIWVLKKGNEFWIGSSTNRGKIQLELQFENLLRYSENQIQLFRKTANKFLKK
jgi:cytochrome c biogenesis protein